MKNFMLLALVLLTVVIDNSFLMAPRLTNFVMINNHSNGTITKINDYISKNITVDSIEPFDEGYLVTYTNNTDYYLTSVRLSLISKNDQNASNGEFLSYYIKPHDQVKSFVKPIRSLGDADRYKIVSESSSVELEHGFSLEPVPGIIYENDITIDSFNVLDSRHINIQLTNHTNINKTFTQENFRFIQPSNLIYLHLPAQSFDIPANTTTTITIESTNNNFKGVNYIEPLFGKSN